MYMDFTQKMIFMYGPEWLKNQFGKNDDSIPDIGGKYWMVDDDMYLDEDD